MSGCVASGRRLRERVSAEPHQEKPVAGVRTDNHQAQQPRREQETIGRRSVADVRSSSMAFWNRGSFVAAAQLDMARAFLRYSLAPHT